MKHLLLWIGLGFSLAAGLVQADEAPVSVPLRLGKKQALLVPVKVGDSIDAEFRLDTGLGFDLISPQLAQKLGIEPSPNHKVRPVTGGELELSQGRLPALAVGNQKAEDLDVVIGEPRLFVAQGGETQVDGILSLAFFKNRPFTLDFANQKLVLEDSESLAKRKAAGTKVDCRLSDENVVASVPLMLTERAPDPKPEGIMGFLGLGGGAPEPPTAWVRVDTGCENLLLDSKLMFTLKVDATGANVTETEPTDPNGTRFRSWASHLGKIGIVDSPALAQERAAVVFRKLLADGVLGREFLHRYTVTFDLPNSELIFARVSGQ